jgi:hypothetical protein
MDKGKAAHDHEAADYGFPSTGLLPDVDASKIAAALVDVFPELVVASLAGVKGEEPVRKWAEHDSEPTPSEDRRLRFAYEIFDRIRDACGRGNAASWLLAINPRLGYESPVKAIREDRFEDTAAAARAFLDGGYDG